MPTKMSLQSLKNLFNPEISQENTPPAPGKIKMARISKHQKSKKGAKHAHRKSLGERNNEMFVKHGFN